MKHRRYLASVCGLMMCGCAATPPAPSAPPKPPAVTQLLPVPPLCDLRSAGLSVDANWLLSACEDALEVRDGATGWVTAQRPVVYPGMKAAFSRDGKLVVQANSGLVEVRDRETLSLLHVVAGHNLTSYGSAFDLSADNQRLAVLFGDGPLLEASLAKGSVLWQLNDAVQAKSLRYVRGEVLLESQLYSAGQQRNVPWLEQTNGYFALSPDGTKVAYSDAKVLKVLDASSGRELSHLDGWAASEVHWYGEDVGGPLRSDGELELRRLDQPKYRVRIPTVAAEAQQTADRSRLRSVEPSGLCEWSVPEGARRRLAWSKPSQRNLRESTTVDGQVLDWWEEGDDRARGLRVTEPDGSVRHLEFETNAYPRVFSLDPFKPLVTVPFADQVAVYDTHSFDRRYEVRLGTSMLEARTHSGLGQLAVLDRQRVSFFDLKDGHPIRQVEVGNYPSDLQLSRDGQYFGVIANGDLLVGSVAGPTSFKREELVRSFAFTDDSRSVRRLDGKNLITYELGSKRETERRVLSFECRQGSELAPNGALTCATSVGKVQLVPGRERPEAITPPLPERARALGFRDGELWLVLPHGAVARLKLHELSALARSAPVATSGSLSPDGKQLQLFSTIGSNRGPHPLEEAWSGQSKPAPCAFACMIRAWSPDGESFITDADTVEGKPGTVPHLEPASGMKALAFAGSAQQVLARAESDALLLVELGKAEPRKLADEGQLAAQSRDQRAIALTTDWGRKLSVLQGPAWRQLTPPVVVDGVVHAALSDDGGLLAFVDESNTLEVRSTRAFDKPGRRYALRAAPGVFGVSFDPSGRFVLLEGSPLRFVRLADGETMNLYVGYLDHADRKEAPLLLVSEHDELQGDARLAHALFCDSRPEPFSGRAEACRLPPTAPGLARWFFSGN